MTSLFLRSVHEVNGGTALLVSQLRNPQRVHTRPGNRPNLNKVGCSYCLDRALDQNPFILLLLFIIPSSGTLDV